MAKAITLRGKVDSGEKVFPLHVSMMARVCMSVLKRVYAA